jgi:hypothetical protein
MLHFGFPLFLALSALLGGDHVDIARHERYLLAPALGARRFQGFVLGDGFGALKLLSAFLATILVGQWTHSSHEGAGVALFYGRSL